MFSGLFSRAQANIPTGTRAQEPIPDSELEAFVKDFVENLPAGIFGSFTNQGEISINFSTIDTY